MAPEKAWSLFFQGAQTVLLFFIFLITLLYIAIPEEATRKASLPEMCPGATGCVRHIYNHDDRSIGQ